MVPSTGFLPDLAMLSELRLEMDPILEAPLLDPACHRCGTVAGMKSHGRGPTFLLATGYGQVRSIAAVLVADRDAADGVEAGGPGGQGAGCAQVQTVGGAA